MVSQIECLFRGNREKMGGSTGYWTAPVDGGGVGSEGERDRDRQKEQEGKRVTHTLGIVYITCTGTSFQASSGQSCSFFWPECTSGLTQGLLFMHALLLARMDSSKGFLGS